MRSSLNVGATQVADEFIDRYMPQANGEYVKVYLYLLRHTGEQVTVSELADALNCTESDIRRALTYWERLGVLTTDCEGKTGTSAEKQKEPAGICAEENARLHVGTVEEDVVGAVSPQVDRQPAAAVESCRRSVPRQSEGEAGRNVENGLPDARIPAQRPTYTPEQVRELSGDEEFTQLLYVAQKYLNKVFTPRECEVFAYLYDGLRMPAELLEYLVEYCVQGAHTSIRYIETVGLNWHERGVCTVEQAKQYTASYSGEAFAVMRAFGLSDRRPGSSEMEMIHRWFREWGLEKDLIMEACARTLIATNKPSFAYADRILMEWKKADVRTMEDVRKLDGQRERARGAEAQSGAGRADAGSPVTQTVRGGAGGRGTSRAVAGAGTRNRFHNFEQRNTDYDAIVLRQVKERLSKQ